MARRVAAWFETRSFAALLTMSVRGLHPEEARSDVSKDEATNLEAPQIAFSLR